MVKVSLGAIAVYGVGKVQLQTQPATEVLADQKTYTYKFF